jgi:hypothetical protein
MNTSPLFTTTTKIWFNVKFCELPLQELCCAIAPKPEAGFGRRCRKLRFCLKLLVRWMKIIAQSESEWLTGVKKKENKK